MKLLKASNFTFSQNVFCAICFLKSFNSHIFVVICSFFEFGMVSKWFIREWVKQVFSQIQTNFILILVQTYLFFHRLRNKFLKLILISVDSVFWELAPNVWANEKNPCKVDTRFRESNLDPHTYFITL